MDDELEYLADIGKRFETLAEEHDMYFYSDNGQRTIMTPEEVFAYLIEEGKNEKDV